MAEAKHNKKLPSVVEFGVGPEMVFVYDNGGG